MKGSLRYPYRVLYLYPLMPHFSIIPDFHYPCLFICEFRLILKRKIFLKKLTLIFGNNLKIV